MALTRNSVAPEFFEVYRVPIVAGRNLIGTFLEPDTPAEILVNESGARALGYASPQEAVEKFLTYDTDMTRMRSKIVGVVPDLRFATVSDPAQPMIFDNSSKYFNQVSIRLDPIQGGETISAIESAWDRNMGSSIPVDKRLFYDYLLQQYHDLYQQIQVFNLVSAVAILLSVLGLTGLSIFLTRHQVREMAIRRALGATFGDIFVQRLTPFFLPLLGANLVAWPIAWLALEFWLKSFASHVALSLSSFIGAGLISIVFALITLALRCLFASWDVPIRSLRHA